jgi:sialic acid synthase SpsE
MADKTISIDGRAIGPSHPVYFIAEAGSNHDGNLDQARRLIDVAAKAGADAVKFQAFKAESLYPRSAGQSAYLKDSRSIYDIIRALEMPLEWIPELAAHCAKQGVHFLCTPFDHGSADALAPYVPAFKIASYDMTNYPLLQHVARKGKPVIVSTGTATLDEVREMIAAVRAVADPGLVVLQCTAKYPAPLAALHVKALVGMAKLGVLTGLSDHSREPLPGPLAAVAVGAVVIEKHYTLSNGLPGPDHAYAIEPAELTDLIAKIRQVEAALGSEDKAVHPEEHELRAFARRTVFTTRSLSEGEPLRRGDLALLRRGSLPDGFHPKEYVRLFGRPLRRTLGPETPLRSEDVGSLLLTDGDVALRPFEKPDVAPDRRAALDQLDLRSDRLEFAIMSGSSVVGTAVLSDIDLGANRAEAAVTLTAHAPPERSVERRAMALLVNHAFDSVGLEELRQSVGPPLTPTSRAPGGR